MEALSNLILIADVLGVENFPFSQTFSVTNKPFVIFYVYGWIKIMLRKAIENEGKSPRKNF
ncbi:MAG: hypothetical protein LBI77_00370, partial [Puniceicoccales bacterium]|nr:hypothetical protein [Puniceicoccales bacterium]